MQTVKIFNTATDSFIYHSYIIHEENKDYASNNGHHMLWLLCLQVDLSTPMTEVVELDMMKHMLGY